MITNHSNYRSFLRTVLQERIRTNPRYSLRAFARHIDLTPSMLSDVLANKKNLSPATAIHVAQRLQLNDLDTELFSILVLLESEKSEERKIYLKKRIQELRPGHEAKDLTVDVFLAISEWYHFPILELTNLATFKFTPENIAKKLGITKLQTTEAIDRLLRLELLEKNSIGKFKKTKDNIVMSSNVPNAALRKFHKQMLSKAIDSLETQSPSEKIVGSETLAFSKGNFKEANQIIENCFQKIFQLSRKGQHHDSVYHLGIQFFRLTEKENHK